MMVIGAKVLFRLRAWLFARLGHELAKHEEILYCTVSGQSAFSSMSHNIISSQSPSTDMRSYFRCYIAFFLM